jgi:hypothetical protein
VLIEEDHKCILIIGGINIFLPSNPVAANAHIEGAEGERQPIEIVKEEKEKKLTFVKEMREEEEHSYCVLT